MYQLMDFAKSSQVFSLLDFVIVVQWKGPVNRASLDVMVAV